MENRLTVGPLLWEITGQPVLQMLLCTVPRSEEKVTPKPPAIEVNGVDFSFKAGDAPRFTGSVMEDALYCIDHERWNNLKEGWTSSDYWNGKYGDFDGSWDMPLTKFKALETYYYGICLSLSAEDIGKDIILIKT